MRDLLAQLESSLTAEHHLLSLFVALTIPDIGGAMDSANGWAKPFKYVDWYEKWVRPLGAKIFRDGIEKELPPDIAAHYREFMADKQSVNPLTGKACYAFRCSLLHQGRMKIEDECFNRIIFFEPKANSIRVHQTVINDALVIDAGAFCREMLQGATDWLAAVESTARYQSNLEHFVRRYPNGLAPYVSGLPVVA